MKYWSNTNDINSPTHSSDLWDDLLVLISLDTLTKEQAEILETSMCDILSVIKKL